MTTRRVRKAILNTISWFFVLIIFAGLIIYLLDQYLLADLFVGMFFKPTEKMSTAITQIELTPTGERIMKGVSPVFQDADSFNKNCPNTSEDTSTLGCYYNNHIYVYDVQNQEMAGIHQAVLAHEFLHAVWARTSGSEKEELTELLKQTYEANRDAFGSHMDYYTDDVRIDELHSIIGTQLRDNLLNSKLREHYDKYFKSRNGVVAYYEQYHGKFEDLEKRADELHAQITQGREEIAKMRESYLNGMSELNAEIENFNARADRGEFATDEQFYAERNMLVSRQSALSQQFQALNQKIDEINLLVEEYNANIARTSELFDSINSMNGKIEESVNPQESQ